ncbi:G-protein coupled receptor 35 [Egretta garzetta]|nr:G-protein coupled receptor 35 [Egretta garzetta]
MENCTTGDDALQNDIALFQLIVYIPVFSFGIPLNTIAFWVFCCKLKRWTETRVYMINLMVADSFLLFSLPFMIYFTKYDHPIGKLCFTIQNIYFTNMPMSILIITLIAIDRYIAIKFPLKAKILRSPLKSASICGFLWITLIIYSYLHPKFHERKEQLCFRKQSLQPSYISLFSIIFGYFIPLGIVIFCSVQVIKCLKKKTATSPHGTKLIQKAIHIISVNLCVFIVCFSPFYITLLLRFAVDVAGACSLITEVRASIQICACLANSNCCLDAFCYYFAAKEFQEFPSLFPTCISMRCKMNQEQESQPSTDQVMTKTRCTTL